MMNDDWKNGFSSAEDFSFDSDDDPIPDEADPIESDAGIDNEYREGDIPGSLSFNPKSFSPFAPISEQIHTTPEPDKKTADTPTGDEDDAAMFFTESCAALDEQKEMLTRVIDGVTLPVKNNMEEIKKQYDRKKVRKYTNSTVMQKVTFAKPKTTIRQKSTSSSNSGLSTSYTPTDVDPTQRNSLKSHSHHNNHLNQACRQTCSKHRVSE